jgi:hypothetical protein
MDTKYFYVKDNKPVGPLTLPELLEKVISSKTYVWTKGMENWAMLESIPELYKVLQLKKENPPRFQNEDTIEYKEENPPRFQKEDTMHFQKEDSIQQKEENAPLSKKEKRYQIFNSVLLVINLIAVFYLTKYAFGEIGEGIWTSMIDEGIWTFIFSVIFLYLINLSIFVIIAEKLGLEKLFESIGKILFNIFLVSGAVLTVIAFIVDRGPAWDDVPFITRFLYFTWTIVVFILIIVFLHKKLGIQPKESLYVKYYLIWLFVLISIKGVFISIYLLIINHGDFYSLSIYSADFIYIFAYLLFIGIIAIFIFFITWIINKIGDKLNKNLTKTKWFLLTGCLILGLTAGYIQIKNVKLKAENLQLEKKLSKNTPTWSYNTEVTFPNFKFIDINFRGDKTRKVMINNTDTRFSIIGNKVRISVPSSTTINSIKIIDNENVTHDIRQQ